MLKKINGDSAPAQVTTITFVPFLPNGDCILIEGSAGPSLPTAVVQEDEDYLIDTALRIWLQAEGFRCQHLRPFGLDENHIYVWIEGSPLTDRRTHPMADLSTWTPEQAAARLRAFSQSMSADAVLAAADSYRTLDDQSFYADNLYTIQRAYLRGRTPQEGSGFSGGDREWRQARHHVSEGISRDGTFLDVGCANGLLMESVADWCAERGLRVEPYGVDLVPGLVERARRRLPHWADRIWVGNAIDWRSPEALRFDYVHVLLDYVPKERRADLVSHHLRHTVRPGTGRLLVSGYAASPLAGGSAADMLRSLGFCCSGQSLGDQSPGRPPAPTAWIDIGAWQPPALRPL